MAEPGELCHTPEIGGNSFFLLVEVDEDQHKRLKRAQEKKREMELSRAFRLRPMVVLRFNQDAYQGSRSCWEKDLNGKLQVNPLRASAWGGYVEVGGHSCTLLVL